jgi:hypothetical protein
MIRLCSFDASSTPAFRPEKDVAEVSEKRDPEQPQLGIARI